MLIGKYISTCITILEFQLEVEMVNGTRITLSVIEIGIISHLNGYSVGFLRLEESPVHLGFFICHNISYIIIILIFNLYDLAGSKRNSILLLSLNNLLVQIRIGGIRIINIYNITLFIGLNVSVITDKRNLGIYGCTVTSYFITFFIGYLNGSAS